MVTVPYLDLHNEKRFYTRQGDGSHPSLVLIHGAGGSHLDWPQEIRRLPGTTVYTLDLPGHGRSTGLPRNRIEEYAKDVIHLLNELRLERYVLTGYSMGGAIALEIGLQNLPAIAGLVLISTGARLKVSPEFLNLLDNDFVAAASGLVNLYWTPNTPSTDLERSRGRLLAAGRQVTLADFKACDCFDRMDECSNLEAPALIICGTEDQLTPPKYSRYLSEQFADAQLLEVSNAGHMVFLEQPAIVASAIGTFLAKLPDNTGHV